MKLFPKRCSRLLAGLFFLIINTAFQAWSQNGVTIHIIHPWEDDPEYRKLWDCLGYDPRPVDLIIEKSGLTARAVSAMLLMLELRGMVEAYPGGAYSRHNKR